MSDEDHYLQLSVLELFRMCCTCGCRYGPIHLKDVSITDELLAVDCFPVFVKQETRGLWQLWEHPRLYLQSGDTKFAFYES